MNTLLFLLMIDLRLCFIYSFYFSLITFLFIYVFSCFLFKLIDSNREIFFWNFINATKQPKQNMLKKQSVMLLVIFVYYT